MARREVNRYRAKAELEREAPDVVAADVQRAQLAHPPCQEKSRLLDFIHLSYFIVGFRVWGFRFLEFGVWG